MNPEIRSNREIIGQLFDDISNNIYNQISGENKKINVYDWPVKFRYIDNAPWSYENFATKLELGKYDIQPKKFLRPYLEKYLKDESPEKAIIKPRQSELTENQINQNLYYAIELKLKIGHYFPTDDLGDAISNEKIATAIRESPYIANQLVGQGNVRRYIFNSGGLFTITGAMKKSGGRAGSRDILVFDEWDWIKESVLGVYKNMLSHSFYKWIRFISTGTAPGIGIDKQVNLGSDNNWFFKCPKCKKEQGYIWPDSIINIFERPADISNKKYYDRLNKVYIGCVKCGKYIDRNSLIYAKNALWVPKKKFLEGIYGSYRLTAPMIPWKTGKEIISEYHKLADYRSQFFNEVWGIAHIEGGSKISEAEIYACKGTYTQLRERIGILNNISVGIDWGINSSWILIIAGNMIPGSVKPAIIYLEEINLDVLLKNNIAMKDINGHLERVCQIIDIFRPEIIIDDQNGPGHAVHGQLAQRYPGRTWGVFYDTSEGRKTPRLSKLLEPQWNDSQKRLTISKVRGIKSMIYTFRNQDILIPEFGENQEVMHTFVRHMQGLSIQNRLDIESQRDFEVPIKLGPEHFFDTTIYALTGYNSLIPNYSNESPGVIIPKTISTKPQQRYY